MCVTSSTVHIITLHVSIGNNLSGGKQNKERNRKEQKKNIEGRKKAEDGRKKRGRKK